MASPGAALASLRRWRSQAAALPACCWCASALACSACSLQAMLSLLLFCALPGALPARHGRSVKRCGGEASEEEAKCPKIAKQALDQGHSSQAQLHGIGRLTWGHSARPMPRNAGLGALWPQQHPLACQCLAKAGVGKCLLGVSQSTE